MITASSLLRRGRTGAVAALALLGALTGCKDESSLISAPDRPSLSTGTYNPILSPEVRVTPVTAAPGRTYRYWYLIENTASDTRSYWVWGYESSGTLEQVGRSSDFSLQPGEKRWVYVDMAVHSISTDTKDVELYFDAHDSQGDAYGYTRHILSVHVSKLLPVVGFVGENHTDKHYGQTRQDVYPGEIKTVRVRLGNPLGARHTLCMNWLEDEGLNGQTTRPAPNSRCLEVDAYSDTEVNFAYRVSPTASAGALDRQALQVYSLADPNAVVYGYLKSTTVSSPSQQQFKKFYAWTFNANQVGNQYGIPLQVKEAIESGQDREYVGINFWQGTTWSWGSHDRAYWVNYAATHPGRIYIVHDEPDQPQRHPDGSLYNPPAEPAVYAEAYYEVAKALRDGDPTARISPAGFAQRYQETTGPNGETWLHGTDYAAAFLTAYRDRYGEDPPVAEWRFHALEVSQTTWEDYVRHDTNWARQHGAPLVVGSFRGDTQAAMMERIKDQSWLNADAGWIRSAAWYSYDHFDKGRTLVDTNYALTSYGCEFVWQAQGVVGPGCPAR